MTKIAYNACFGGFGLSTEAFEKLLDKKGVKWERFETGGVFGRHSYQHPDTKERISKYDLLEDRTDKDLISVIEELGEAAFGEFSRLRIADIPSGTRYRIDEYDGNESVMTPDDYDWKIA